MAVLTHDFDETVERRGTDAQKYSAALCPEGVLPMWVADTDFRCPQPLLDKLAERVAAGHFGYAAAREGFGDAVARWMGRRFAWRIDPSWVEFAPSAVHPLLYSVLAFSAPGDSVLVQTPVYPNFYALIRQNGRQVVANPLGRGASGYFIDFENLEKGLAEPRTRIMFLCNPHNPTGLCLGRDDLARVGRLCAKHKVFLVSDEVHCDIVYPGSRHIPLASLEEADAAFASCPVVISPAKTFNTAGLQAAAFICKDPEVRAVLLEQRLALRSGNRNIMGALAVEELYDNCEYYADQLVRYLHENLRLVRERLGAFSGRIRFFEPQATYLLWLDCTSLGMSRTDLNIFFLDKAGLLLSDGENFGPEGAGFMRMNIACRRRTLAGAMDRLCAALSGLR